MPTPGHLAHFSINADDVTRACDFYHHVFGWTVEPYGPPGFFMISFPGAGDLLGSIQGRRELVKDSKMTGFECTIAVADIDKAIRQIEAAGGNVVMPKATIPGVGHLIFFQDTEGNVAGAMEYDVNAA